MYERKDANGERVAMGSVERKDAKDRLKVNDCGLLTRLNYDQDCNKSSYSRK